MTKFISDPANNQYNLRGLIHGLFQLSTFVEFWHFSSGGYQGVGIVTTKNEGYGVGVPFMVPIEYGSYKIVRWRSLIYVYVLDKHI